jgi:hypothetical protein
MGSRLALVILTLAFVCSASAQSSRISAKDLRPLEGKQWVGVLTYLDYNSKKTASIRSNIEVTRSKTDGLSWFFELQYPLEPGANSRDTVKLSPDGRTLDGENVIERKKLANGVLRIVTVKAGKDDNRDAVFRHTYLISKSSFSIKKEVRFDGTAEFFERHTFVWTR